MLKFLVPLAALAAMSAPAFAALRRPRPDLENVSRGRDPTD